MPDCEVCGEEPATTVRDDESVCFRCAIEYDAELFAGAWSCGESEHVPDRGADDPNGASE